MSENMRRLNNFTMCNLMAEGMLTAKSLFPEEFESYQFDELEYLRKTLAELRKGRLSASTSLRKWTTSDATERSTRQLRQPRTASDISCNKASGKAAKVSHWKSRRSHFATAVTSFSTRAPVRTGPGAIGVLRLRRGFWIFRRFGMCGILVTLHQNK